MIFIFGAALLLFGPRKLPEIGRTLGKGMAEFRKASAELKRSLDTESIEHEVRETQRAIQQNDPRRYLREAAAFDERRVARGTAEPETPADAATDTTTDTTTDAATDSVTDRVTDRADEPAAEQRATKAEAPADLDPATVESATDEPTATAVATASPAPAVKAAE